MLFGKKDTFAIEAYLNQIDRRVFTNYCFWVKNSRIGDLAQNTLISSIIDLIDIFFSSEGTRENAGINESDYRVTIEHFINEYIEDMNGYKFNIGSFHDECLQGYYIFIVEKNGYDLVLIKDDIKKQYLEAKIPKNSVAKCFKYLKNWIKDSTVLVLKDYLNSLEHKYYQEGVKDINAND